MLHHSPDKPLEVRTVEGSTGNILWFYKGENKYALAFNHNNSTIEIRERSTHGKAIHSVTNSTTIAQLEQIFENI